jgi:hypothetical protein
MEQLLRIQFVSGVEKGMGEEVLRVCILCMCTC